jgi:hypothetical protein
MSILSLAVFNVAVPRAVDRVLVGTDTVAARGTPHADQLNDAGTFDGHRRGLSHGHGHARRLSSSVDPVSKVHGHYNWAAVRG